MKRLYSSYKVCLVEKRKAVSRMQIQLCFPSILFLLMMTVLCMNVFAEEPDPIESIVPIDSTSENSDPVESIDQIDNSNEINSLLFTSQPPLPEKSANLAMMMSAVIPGAGQFYVNKRSITAYIFPVIEIGLWYLKGTNQKKGDDMTKDYEKFADEHYDMMRQFKVQRNLIENPFSGTFYGDSRELSESPDFKDPIKRLDYWGNGAHFRLKKDDMQHYYEDIGKYTRYIYGWSDWYGTYVQDIDDVNVFVDWVFNGEVNPLDIRWIGNKPIANPEETHITKDTPFEGSALRSEYVKMRDKAEDYYSVSDVVNFGILANHLVAAIDARRVANKHNAQQQRASINPQINTMIIDNRPIPLFGFNIDF